MHSADEPPPSEAETGSAETSRHPTSVALLAAVACVPIVIATGFIVDRSPPASTAAAVPGDISVLALRRDVDAGPARRPDPPVRAGY